MPKTSIVHFGPGAFHRAHQAAYTDDLIEKTGGDFGICGVSLRSSSVRDALQIQDFNYTLAILDHTTHYKRIRAINEILVAPENPGRVIEKLAKNAIKTVTLTITEKGYTLAPNGQLDLKHPDIQHDLSNLSIPVSAIGYLVAGLNKRRASGRQGLTIISCDNIPENSQKLGKAIIDFAHQIDPSLGLWIKDNCSFPSTMVDSITPATDAALKTEVRKKTGIDDPWPIQREAFTQWVIEDLEDASLPPWHLVGATLSKNITDFEVAKLRVLNGMHSSLAFTGLFMGLETVKDAVANSEIRNYIESMCYNEIIPSLPHVYDLNHEDYAKSILARFENPAINHYLAQIFWDSSQKLPIRILDTIIDNLNAGRPIKGLTLSVAAWMATADLYAVEDRDMTDPHAKTLLGMKKATAQDYLNIDAIFSQDLLSHAEFTDQVSQYFSMILRHPNGLTSAMLQASTT